MSRLDLLAERLGAVRDSLAELSALGVDAVLDRTGNVTMLLGEAQQALIRSEEFHRQCIARAPVAMLELDSDGVIRFANMVAEDMAGANFGGLDGRRWHEVVGGAVADDAWDWLRRNPGHEREIHHRPSEGRRIAVRWSLVRREAWNGEPATYLAYGLDLTSRREAEKRLALVRSQLTDTIESIPEGLAVFDRREHLAAFNRRYAEICRQMGVELRLGMGFGDVVAGVAAAGNMPEAVNREADWISERMTLRGNQKVAFERRLFDGSWLRIVEHRTYDGMTVVLAHDITDLKKRAEELADLAQRNALLASAIEAATIGIVITDAEATGNPIIYANDAYAEMTGYRVAEVIGRSPDFMNGPETDPAARTRLREAVRAGRPETVEILNYRKDGSPFWQFLRIAPVHGVGGAIANWIGIQTDITERRRTEEALRRSEEHYRALLETVPLGVQELDQEFRIAYANRAFHEMMAAPPGGLVGIHVWDVVEGAEEAKRLETTLHRLTVEQPPPSPYFGRNRTRDGRIIDIRVDWDYQRDADGNLEGFIAVVTDITERLRAGIDRAVLERKLQQAQKMEALGSLAGGIAHEFNNTLVPILGLTELVLDELPEGGAARANLEHVIDSADRARRIVKQILAFSRTDNPEPEPLDITAVLHDICGLLRATIPTTIAFDCRLPDRPLMVIADATQLHQILMNLAANAVHALDISGRLTLTLTERVLDEAAARLTDLAPGRHALLAFTDTGSGMTPEVLANAFTPFYTTKPVGEGTGMGLAVVHGIVVGWGGAVTADSRPGEGTTITIHLPLIEHSALSGPRC